MREEHRQELEKLSKICYCAGIFPIFLGLIVIFIRVVNRDWTNTMVGILIFTMGYACVKISTKLKKILSLENHK